jgi:hypothetical protein
MCVLREVVLLGVYLFVCLRTFLLFGVLKHSKSNHRGSLVPAHLRHFMFYDVISLPNSFNSKRQRSPRADKSLSIFSVFQSLGAVKHLEWRKTGSAGIGTYIFHSSYIFYV